MKNQYFSASTGALTDLETATLARDAATAAWIIANLPNQYVYGPLVVEFFALAALASAKAEARFFGDDEREEQFDSRMLAFANHRRFLTTGLAEGLLRLDSMSMYALRALRSRKPGVRTYRARLTTEKDK